MPIAWETIEPLLMRVEKPARYVGGEFNQVVKPTAAARVCLAYPDLYEIGMSYHGYRLLYERINARPQWAAERAYAPWPDFEALLRQRQIPLYSLETRRGLAEFDWVGFTLQHEVNFTNVLNMIDLAGLPLRAADRPAPAPLLIGGGEGAFSPEPLAPFLDAFVLGDGEEVVLELMALAEQAKRESWDKPRLLRELARRPGIYVPAFYRVDYHADGRIASVRPVDGEATESAPPVIQKRHFQLSSDLGAVKPLVPLMRAVHDRLTIETRRGCVAGCRFCQAGMVTRPVQERPPRQVLEIARQGLAATGYDEISLLSLSTADYTMIGPLVRELNRELGPRHVSISLPSLRIDGFDVSLADEIIHVRKTGFTFAEAGAGRLRQAINKPVDQEAFRRMIEDVFRRGWQTVKFYFMIGLPTETDADLDGIAEICRWAAELGRQVHRGRATINVTLSPFVPKAHTPFQWEAQPPREELARRCEIVRCAIRERAGRSVQVKTANVGAAFVEAVLARGDRRLGEALERAWRLGARFDGWDEHFRLDTWLRAFAETGLDPAFYANRERGEDEIFPFEHLDARLGRRFLWEERRRSRQGRPTPRCDIGPCAGCEVCDDEVRHALADDSAIPGLIIALTVAGARDQSVAVARLRLVYAKRAALRFLSHLDFIRVVGMILRRAQIPLAWSRGFNPQPRLQYAPPLSLGMSGERELLDVFLERRMEPAAMLAALGRIPLDGLVFLDGSEIPLAAPSLEAQIHASTYAMTWRATCPAESACGPKHPAEDSATALDERLEWFHQQSEWIVALERPKGDRQVDLKQAILRIETNHPDAASATDRAAARITISHRPGLFVKPHEALGHLLGRRLQLGVDVQVTREKLWLTPPASPDA